MRFVASALAALVLLVLASIQLVASLAVRNRAVAGSWLSFVPPAAAARVERLDPALPLPSPLRLLLARRALQDGDLALASRWIVLLPPSRDRSSLEGGLAEANGDALAAARGYLAADDLSGVERLIAGAERRGDPDGALALQSEVVGRLRADRTQSDTLAEAYYRLGLLEEEASWRLPVGDARRRADELHAKKAYDGALVLAPFSQRYLIAAASQELNLGDLDAAAREYARARNADPASSVALVGLGEVALRRGDVAGAGAWLARARAIDPTGPAVLRLAHKLER